MIAFIKSHALLEAVVGYVLFFGGYLFLMVMATLIGDWLDRKFYKEKDK